MPLCVCPAHHPNNNNNNSSNKKQHKKNGREEGGLFMFNLLRRAAPGARRVSSPPLFCPFYLHTLRLPRPALHACSPAQEAVYITAFLVDQVRCTQHMRGTQIL